MCRFRVTKGRFRQVTTLVLCSWSKAGRTSDTNPNRDHSRTDRTHPEFPSQTAEWLRCPVSTAPYDNSYVTDNGQTGEALWLNEWQFL